VLLAGFLSLFIGIFLALIQDSRSKKKQA
jgi:uncharacterized protein involved in exopolysaccharide biosynthesis